MMFAEIWYNLLPTAYVVRQEGYVLTRVCPSICLSWGGGTQPVPGSGGGEGVLYQVLTGGGGGIPWPGYPWQGTPLGTWQGGTWPGPDGGTLTWVPPTPRQGPPSGPNGGVPSQISMGDTLTWYPPWQGTPYIRSQGGYPARSLGNWLGGTLPGPDRGGTMNRVPPWQVPPSGPNMCYTARSQWGGYPDLGTPRQGNPLPPGPDGGEYHELGTPLPGPNWEGTRVGQ